MSVTVTSFGGNAGLQVRVPSVVSELTSMLAGCIASSQSVGACFSSSAAGSFRKNSRRRFRFSKLAMRVNFFRERRRYFWFLFCFRRGKGRTPPPVFSGSSVCPPLVPTRLLPPPPNLRDREKQSFSFPLCELLRSMLYSLCSKRRFGLGPLFR